MDQQLEFGLQLVGESVRVRYVSVSDTSYQIRDDEIYIDKSLIGTCPNQKYLIEALQKKINRSDLFRSQKYTLGLCCMILLSKGYCITSVKLKNIDDAFIERCWECIHVTSHNVFEGLAEWIRSCMDGRTPSDFAMMYCASGSSSGSSTYLGRRIQGSTLSVGTAVEDFNMSESVWHRDDVMRLSIMSHLSLTNGRFPYL